MPESTEHRDKIAAALQTARYRASTRAEAMAAFNADRAMAAGWGHRPIAATWDEDESSAVLVVTYAHTPDPTVLRRYAAGSRAFAQQLFALDVPRMAVAGYVPVSSEWHPARPSRRAAAMFGWLNLLSQDGELEVIYQYDPDAAGAPTGPIPPPPPSGLAPGWPAAPPARG